MSFDSVISNLPDDSIKANILYNLSRLDSDEDKNTYKEIVLDSYNNDLFGDNDYLFFYKLYPEIEKIHERISYEKHDQVIRKGPKCKFCKSENTLGQEQQRGGGDEYIPSRVQCFECGKNYLY